MQSPDSIVSLLESAARTAKTLRAYAAGETTNPECITYTQLLRRAQDNTRLLRALPAWRHGGICLIHLNSHLSNIEWFWSVTLAGGIPAMCPPFAPGDARAKLDHLCNVLSSPLCLTTQDRLFSDFGQYTGSGVSAIEDLQKMAGQIPPDQSAPQVSHPVSSIATIVLTSGSSGNSKAVPLSHGQIVSAINGKWFGLPCDLAGGALLNWVGMDHVAGIVEAHIRALALRVDQVHAEAVDIVANPAIFLELLDRHNISTSFAPNFLLAKIVDGVDQGHIQLPANLNLKNLYAITSGGEANTTEVCQRVSRLLLQYGAPANTITPGFGMTETCAGCIFNRNFSDSALHEQSAITSAGKCMPGVEMRVTALEDAVTASTIKVLDANVIGSLELRGPAVFTGYINNAEANASAFTSDGWFRTGDMGFIDQDGNLVLTGRTKDVVCINGVSHLAVDQERAVEDGKIPGVTPNCTVCFAWRPPGAATEQCCIVYEYSYDAHDDEARALAQTLISKAILLHTGARPLIIPVPPGILTRSSMGKLPRSKIKAEFEHGAYASEMALNAAALNAVKSAEIIRPTNDAERKMMRIVESVLQLEAGELSIDTAFFDAGITSVDLIRLKSQICHEFSLPTISITVIITHNTVRLLTKAITKLLAVDNTSRYEPVVKLRSSGSKTPLWLIHPGVGEVLVFVGLAQYIQDRPVYALRARGFEAGEDIFHSIDETVATYTAAICSQQPDGPYAIAGYSYGSMLAFEVAKRLRAAGKTVGFIGCLNLPPHIKSRMRQLTIPHCLVHLALFLQLINDSQASDLEKEAADMSFESTLSLVLAKCDHARLHELDLTPSALSRWVDVAYSLQHMAVDYEPSGVVQNLDVFYCDPLATAARSKKEWLEEQLSQWHDFCEDPPRFHPVDGAHYTMLSVANVQSFHNTLEKALLQRGL